MITFKIKNLKEIEAEFQPMVEDLFNSKQSYYTELFKNYDKDMVMELILDHSSKVYKASLSLNMKSKKVLLAEEGNDLMKTVNALFSNFKKTVKKRYELERKDYEFKRKR